MTHVEKPWQRWWNDDVHVVFFLCGAFATFGEEYELLPAGIDFVFWPGPWPSNPPDCPTCIALTTSPVRREEAISA